MEAKEELPDFTNYNELISQACGGKIIFATDDFFAVAENLLKDEEPSWKEDVFTDFGKWMDGWETRRRRSAGHDWTIIALKIPSVIKGVCVDTCHFTGNFAPKFSISAANISRTGSMVFQNRESKIGTRATEDDFKRISSLDSENWQTLIPITKLNPGYESSRRNYFEVSSNEKWSHLRLNIYPDGGIARLRVYGTIKPDLTIIPESQLTDLVAKENGGVCLRYSDAHYGHPRNLIKPEAGKNMADGWETARRLDRSQIIRVNDDGTLQEDGEEWAIFRLGCVGTIKRVQVNTRHFKGNYPDNVRLEGALITADTYETTWRTILPARKLSPDTEHCYDLDDLENANLVSHVKVIIAPDGGFSRLRIWGLRA